MNSRPIKQDRLRPRAETYLWNAKAKGNNSTKRNNCSPKLPISFSARASKAGSSSVTTPTARSMPSSTAETTKTLSGAKRSKLSAFIPHDHRTRCYRLDNLSASRDRHRLESLREMENTGETRARTGGNGRGSPGKSAGPPGSETRYRNPTAVNETFSNVS